MPSAHSHDVRHLPKACNGAAWVHAGEEEEAVPAAGEENTQEPAAEPDSPTMAVISPGFTSSSMPLTASVHSSLSLSVCRSI